MRLIAEKAESHNVPLSICGEMAGKPLAAMALLGLGYQALSMAPSAVGPVKAMVRAVDLNDLTKTMRRAIGEPTRNRTIRELLSDYADENGIPW